MSKSAPELPRVPEAPDLTARTYDALIADYVAEHPECVARTRMNIAR